MHHRYQLVKTKDGSVTIEDTEFNATFHSSHGAVTESKHVFIENGLGVLLNRQLQKIQVLEVGFGSGLNAALTFLAAKQHPAVQIDYVSIDAFPLTEDLQRQFCKAFAEHEKHLADAIQQVQMAKWEDITVIGNFRLQKIQASWQEFKPDNLTDLLYYDAFAPSVQPELWNAEAVEKMHKCLNPGGVIVTYCVQGNFRRALNAAGFETEKLPGPPGKREMLRAIKVLR